MKKVSFDIYKKNINNKPSKQSPRFDTVKENKKTIETNTIQGVLLNNYIKDKKQEDFDSFDSISTQLLIPENIKPQED